MVCSLNTRYCIFMILIVLTVGTQRGCLVNCLLLQDLWKAVECRFLLFILTVMLMRGSPAGMFYPLVGSILVTVPRSWL